MRKLPLLLPLAAILSGASMTASAAYNATPNDWLCTNKSTGYWEHGRVVGCDANAFGPDSFVRGNYGPVIYQDNLAWTNSTLSASERKRFMQEMYPAIRDAADRYFSLRKPDASTDEKDGFKRGVFALLRQESFWSHYRDAQLTAAQPYLLKMIRGDSGHGHGMMQVDDRYHFVPLNEGKGWNMLQNFSYGIEIYYAAWQDAPGKCLAGAQAGDPEYWRSRARSAWSAYNGGPTKVCRWQNPADANVAKDNGYRGNYDNRYWLTDVADLAKPAAIDVPCLMDNGSTCPMPALEPIAPGKLIRNGAAACTLVGNDLNCVDDMRDAACLGSLASFDDSSAITAYAVQLQGKVRKDHNRNQLCRATVAGLASLGSAIVTTAELPLRGAVDGAVIGSAPAGSYQVLDFQVQGVQNQTRHYRIRAAGVDGWIEAGDRSSHASVAKSAAPVGAGTYAYPGDWVAVNTTSNLNIRATPGGTQLTSIPRGTALQVQELYATASANNVYYRVNYLGKEGWVFAGNLYPASTLASWVIPTAAANSNKPAHCPSGMRWDAHLRVCQSASTVAGPFTASATAQCQSEGGGAVCTAQRGALIDGRSVLLPLWPLSRALSAVGNGDCPRGASRSAAHRFHCTETVGSDTSVYGPFGTTLVNACLAQQANASFCLTNRWPAAAFLAEQP